MTKTGKLSLVYSITLLLFFIAMAGIRRSNENADAALAARIAPGILRFHVIANSDSPEDQAVKLEIRDLLLKKIRDGLEHTEHNTAPNKTDIQNYITANSSALTAQANGLLARRGFSYCADIRLESAAFPEKTYGDLTFPAGEYDAVRVILGQGEGENYWCVLYPSLCYTDSLRAVVPEESKALLRTLIPEEDYNALLTSRRAKSEAGKLRLRLKLLDLFR